jgi:hypothetical protein
MTASHPQWGGLWGFTSFNWGGDVTDIFVRASRRFTGDGPISLRALANLEHRPFPVSVREMASVDSRELDGRISAGDVDCSFRVTLYNSGRWFITADFHDNGTLLGDSFVLEFPLDGGGRGIVLDHGGSALGAGKDERMNKDGLDPLIRDHWPTIRSAQLTAKLTAAADIESLIVTILEVVAVVGIITFFVSGKPVAAGPCPDQAPDDHGQCVQFRHTSEGGPGSPTITG